MSCTANSSIQGKEYELAKVLAKCPILGYKWKELAHGLKVQEDLANYELEQSCKLRLLKILTQFVSKNGIQATFDKLIAVLEEEEFNYAADSVQLYCETQITVDSPSHTRRKSQIANNSIVPIELHNDICTVHEFQCKECRWIFNIQRTSNHVHTNDVPIKLNNVDLLS